MIDNGIEVFLIIIFRKYNQV